MMAAAGAAIGLGQSVAGMIGMGKAKRNVNKSIDAMKTYSANPEVNKYLEMRRQKLGTGLGGTATKLAQQGIESAAGQASSAAQQMGRGAGLSTIGAIQKQKQSGYGQLAGQSAAAEQQNMASFGQAVGLAGAERQKQFASEQEKQQLKTNIKLQQLAAKRAMVSQGLQGAIGAAASGAAASASSKSSE